IQQVNPDMIGAQIIGRLVSLQEVGEKRAKRLVGQFKDDTGQMELVWFQSVSWLKKGLKVGAAYIIYGKPSEFNGMLSMTHPEIELYQADSKKVGNMTMQPVYSSTEKLKKFNLDSKGLQKLQQTALETIYSSLTENLPSYIIEKHRLMSYNKALLAIHFPQSEEELRAAIRRLKFEELFFIQLRLLRNKQLNTQKYKGHIFGQVGEKFNTFFNERLPFPLTNAQKRVIKEIRQDTNTGAQMNRLVQGDVGSGKTVVALMSMLLAIDNGYQA